MFICGIAGGYSSAFQTSKDTIMHGLQYAYLLIGLIIFYLVAFTLLMRPLSARIEQNRQRIDNLEKHGSSTAANRNVEVPDEK